VIFPAGATLRIEGVSYGDLDSDLNDVGVDTPFPVVLKHDDGGEVVLDLRQCLRVVDEATADRTLRVRSVTVGVNLTSHLTPDSATRLALDSGPWRAVPPIFDHRGPGAGGP
jgi:hypothetical protein